MRTYIRLSLSRSILLSCPVWAVGSVALLSAPSSVPAQATSGPAQTDPSAPKSGAGDAIPVPDLVGVSDEFGKTVQEAYDDAKAHPDDAEKVGKLGILHQQAMNLGAAVQCMELAVRLAPKEVKWHYYLGIVLEDSYEFGKAEAAFRRALELDPNYAPFMIRIADLVREKNPAEAEALYKKAASLSPNNSRAHFGLGECARIQKRNDEAIASYQKAVELAPKFAKAHGALARLLEAKGDKVNAGIHADAEKRGREPRIVGDPLLVQMLSIGADPEWLLDVAGQLIDSGDFKQAILIVDRLKAFPKYKDQANKLLGRLNFFQLDLDESVKYLTDYLREFQNDDEHRIMLSHALVELNRFDDAAREMQVVVKNRPDDVDVLHQVGNIALLRGDANAAFHFQRMTVLNRKHPGGWAGLIVAFVAASEFEKAVKVYVTGMRAFGAPEDLDCDLLGRLLHLFGEKASSSSGVIDFSLLDRFADALQRNNYADSAERFRNRLQTVTRGVTRFSGKGNFEATFALIRQCIDADEGGLVRDSMSETIQLLHKQSAKLSEQFFRDNEKMTTHDSMLTHMLAWTRATSAEASLRNAADAIRLAEMADKATGHKNPEVLDTLAAAYAESGDFDRAVKVMQEALKAGEAAASPIRTERFRARMALYAKKTAYRH